METTTVQVGEKKVAIWPSDQGVEVEADPAIKVTRFDDIEDYHPQLIAKILAMEQQQGVGERYFRGAGGTKIYHIEKWGFAEAKLIDVRALTLFKRVLDCKEAVTDLSWANVYRNGDYCMPHSHVRSTASIVYFLDPGDRDLEDQLSGRFFLADPRLNACCKQEEGCLTSPCVPATPPGTMIIFPGKVIHCVNPYTGQRPRVTLAWNINQFPIPGSPFSDQP